MIPEPAPGFSTEFDSKNQRVSDIKKEFKVYLVEQMKRFPDAHISFVH